MEIQNTSTSTSFSSRTNRLLSPSLVVRRIISAYSQNQNDAVPPAPPKTKSSIRIECQYGEVLKCSTLLNELREKAEAKATKTSKNKVAQQTQSSANKKLNELSKCVLYVYIYVLFYFSYYLFPFRLVHISCRLFLIFMSL